MTPAPSRDRVTVVLDTGALIAAERGSARWRSLMRRLVQREVRLAVPAGALAQAWRGTARQARLAQLLADKRICHLPLDHVAAKAAGALLGLAGAEDAVDASVVMCARREHAAMVVTSDPDDLRRLDPNLPVETI
jgi:rRNA-processing protein FCF1